MANRKISVIGAGNVGATTAHILLSKHLGDVVLVDIAEGIAKGKALDLLHGTPIDEIHCHIHGTADMAETKGSDVVVITAGLARKPGMTREELLEKNAAIVGGIAEKAAQVSPKAVFIVATNPLDVMTWLSLKKSKFPRERVLGMAGVLDSARMVKLISGELRVPHSEVKAMVLGSHGEAMVPLPRLCTVSGKPLTEVMPAEKIAEIVERTKNAGAEIVSHLQTGSAYYSPAMSIVEMVSCVLQDKKKILPCSVLLEGEYGEKGVCIGVPVKIGKGGAEEIIELELDEDEKKKLSSASGSIREMIGKLEA
ncbi:MAG: malate dehydrogenase [Candidatus Diapherotrites archaeon]|nr:malate dehydrogenase [Candidatus Micrarchaeota archaeon]MBU1940040.1 malate dehydrogenase [Candidatus Micrarchaeota archaeon]